MKKRIRTAKENKLRAAVREHCRKYRAMQADELPGNSRQDYAMFIERLIGDLRHEKGLETT